MIAAVLCFYSELLILCVECIAGLTPFVAPAVHSLKPTAQSVRPPHPHLPSPTMKTFFPASGISDTGNLSQWGSSYSYFKPAVVIFLSVNFRPVVFSAALFAWCVFTDRHFVVLLFAAVCSFTFVTCSGSYCCCLHESYV